MKKPPLYEIIEKPCTEYKYVSLCTGDLQRLMDGEVVNVYDHRTGELVTNVVLDTSETRKRSEFFSALMIIKQPYRG